MSAIESKTKNSIRRHRDETAIKKQLKIAKQHGASAKETKEPHRFNKHHAMDCGNPNCMLCGNPRHLHKHGRTAQEYRMLQDLDSVRDKHSNGLPNKDDESTE